MPNRLSRFWEELKRRKVVRVATVYAASAFVILELADIIADPFGLPDWTVKLVFVLLAVGLIVSVIISWLYEISPEGSLIKTGPDRVNDSKPQRTPGGWKMASYISFMVIIALIVLNVIPRNKRDKSSEVIDKSIAVLPFASLSDDPDKQYLADGVMDAILLHLSKIEDLRVISRTSVEQYRSTDKKATAICEELDVAYILEGSFQKYGDQARLIVQLIHSGKEEHLWANNYDREWKDIFAVQSEVAQRIAGELEAVIKPAEKELIEKIPTTNMTAYDLYMRAEEAFLKVLMNMDFSSSLEEAEYYLNKALEYDPEYALAYALLAQVEYRKYTRFTVSGDQYAADYFQSRNLDSLNLLAERAIALDGSIAEAYYAKGVYEQERGNLREAMDLMEYALSLDPNSSVVLIGAALVSEDLFDYVSALEFLVKASGMERGPMQAGIYVSLLNLYWAMDLNEMSKQSLEKLTSLTGDSIIYHIFNYQFEFQSGNQEKAFEHVRAAYAIDSADERTILYLGRAYLDAGMYEEAYHYYSKYISWLNVSGGLDVNDMNRIGHSLWMVGKEEEARIYFHDLIGHCREHIRIKSSYGREGATFDLAGVYSFLGVKDSAYHYLEELTRTNWQVSYCIYMLKSKDPLFESIRQEERFRQLVQQMELKHRAERDRVSEWLEENDLL